MSQCSAVQCSAVQCSAASAVQRSAVQWARGGLPTPHHPHYSQNSAGLSQQESETRTGPMAPIYLISSIFHWRWELGKFDRLALFTGKGIIQPTVNKPTPTQCHRYGGKFLSGPKLFQPAQHLLIERTPLAGGVNCPNLSPTFVCII